MNIIFIERENKKLILETESRITDHEFEINLTGSDLPTGRYKLTFAGGVSVGKATIPLYKMQLTDKPINRLVYIPETFEENQ